MGLIKAGVAIGKTIKNVGRFKEIILVFVRYGFGEFISQWGITQHIPHFVLPRFRKRIKKELEQKSDNDWGQILGQAFRKCFEELGPVFVKFGQLLSTREDLFERSFLQEMGQLRNNVKGISFEEAQRAVAAALQKPLGDVFRNFEPTPLGNASIGVAYKAELADGQKVVVKIRRPNIEEIVETDLSILTFLVEQIERASQELRSFGISRLVGEFAISLQNELNLNIEAHNCRKLQANLIRHDKENLFYIPHIYSEYSSEEIMVMELVEGIPFSNTIEIRKCQNELNAKMQSLAQIYIKTFLCDGFFHADLHQGNMFLLADGRIALIDFGLVGNLSRKARVNFVAMIYALLSNNYENLVYEFLEVADYQKIPDIDELTLDIKNSLSPFLGLNLAQIDFTKVFQEMMKCLRSHSIYLPREWFMVFRALLTLESVNRSLEFDLNIFELLEKDMKKILRKSFSTREVMENALWSGREMFSVMRIVPRQLKWFLKEWSKREYALEIINKGYEKDIRKVSGSLTFLGFALITVAFIISGVVIANKYTINSWVDIPILSWIFWGLGVLSSARGYFSLRA